MKIIVENDDGATKEYTGECLVGVLIENQDADGMEIREILCGEFSQIGLVMAMEILIRFARKTLDSDLLEMLLEGKLTRLGQYTVEEADHAKP